MPAIADRLRTITRTAVLLTLTATAGCAAGGAGSMDDRTGGETAAPATGAAGWAGRWTGTFSASVGDGDLAITLRQADGAWTGAITLSLMGESVYGDMVNIVIEGDEGSWGVYIEGADVAFKAKLSGDSLAGTLVAWAEGQAVGDGTWSLTRKP